MSYGGWAPYVPVAKRRAKAAREMNKLRKKGTEIEPIEIQGRKIARTFWGEAWCEHLERFSDFANRLPRGRTYVRNGSVCHLAIKPGKVEAIVSGSALYNVSIKIAPLSQAKWKKLRKQCTGQIGSILELLQGQLSGQVMGVVTHSSKGLFPQPGEIKLHCDCPDWADMCKHVAAVLYGVGARLDEKPELLFRLRKVDQNELISENLELETATTRQGQRRRLANQDLSKLFGIDLEGTDGAAKKSKAPPRKTSKKKTASGSSKTRTSKAKASVKKKTFTPTGAAVSRLRKQFKMTRSQFANLLGISSQTVANWETKRGKLKLQKHTLTALTRAWLRKQA
ncbi:MAG: helix-turn-helix domain-containing protein [Pseudomonadota bacterium]